MSWPVENVSTYRLLNHHVRISLLILGAWGIAVWFLWPFHGTLLDWDEVDYVKAARLGGIANATEAGSLSPSEFFELGLAKLAGQEPHLPGWYDESEDPFLLRHFHPPFVVYLLSLVASSNSERLLRSVQILGSLFLIGATVMGYLYLDNGWSWAGCGVVACLGIWVSQILFRSISFHGWEAVWVSATATFASAWLAQSRSMAVGGLLCGSLILACLTLETGAFLLIGVTCGMLFWDRAALPGKRVMGSWGNVLVGTVIIIIGVILLWPGGVVKAALLKIPAMYLYRMKQGAEYAGVSELLPDLVRTLLPLVLTGAAACLWLILNDRPGIKKWGPPVVIAVVYVAAISRFALRPQYVLPALVPLIPLVGLSYDGLRSTGAKWAASSGVFMLTAALWPSTVALAMDAHAREDMKWLAVAMKARDNYVEGGHIYQHYLGSKYKIYPLTVSPRGLTTRNGGVYRFLDERDVRGKIIVVQRGRPGLERWPIENMPLKDCERLVRQTVIVFDCGTTSEL